MTDPVCGPDRRRVLGWAAVGAGLSLLPGSLALAEPMSLEQRIGQMLLLGFIGSTVDTDGADQIAGHLAAGRIGGVLFLRHNVRTRDGVEGLTARFRAIAPEAWMAVDQEGGVVQRLSRDLGYGAVPRALLVAQAGDADAARAVYAAAALEFRAAGFNMNLAPVADLNDPENAVIGRHGRAYGDDGATVAAYASAFIGAFRETGAVCAIKHFPGHGHSRGDSHAGFVDITATWSDAELDPFRRLIDAGQARLIMCGHLTQRGLDPADVPVTFSAPVIEDLLRGELGFDGVVMTDDLDMAAIRENYSQREAVLRSIEAGNDIIMLSNSAAPDPELPQHIVGWVSEAITEGRLTEARIDQSVARIAALRLPAAMP